MLSQKSVTASSSCVINVPSNEQDVNNLAEDVATNSCCSSQTSSIYSSAVDICRICHCESTSDAPLITPCYCSGSLRYVHQSCLQQWIKSSNTRCCELCKFQFIMQTKIKPFNEWEYLEMSGLERKKLLCAMLFHIIAMTCVCWSLYVLIDRTLDEVQRGHLDWPFWTKLIVVGIGFMGGIIFMYIQCKAYFILCQRWKAYNRVIYVQNAPEKPSTLHGASGNNAPLDGKELCNGPSSKSYSNYHKDSSQTASCIDIKGVRNLHIFFNEDNRIRFHKQDRPVVSAQNKRIENNSVVTSERLPSSAEDGEFRRNNSSSGNSNNNKIDTLVCDRDASWHIEIGNGVDCYNGCSSIDKPSTSQDRSFCTVDNETGCVNATCGSGGSDHYGGALCPSDLLAAGKAKIDIIDGGNNKMETSAEMPSSVVTLQIKKTEIVIEFGGQSNNNNNNNSTSNNNSDSNNLDSTSYRDKEQVNKSEVPVDDLSSDNRDANVTNNDEKNVDVDKKVLNTTATLINDKTERVMETEEKQEVAHEKKVEIDAHFAPDTSSESLLPTTKLLKKNHSSVSLNNIQNNRDVHQITDWNSTDNLLSIP